jgi:hypothetical protein
MKAGAPATGNLQTRGEAPNGGSTGAPGYWNRWVTAYGGETAPAARPASSDQQLVEGDRKVAHALTALAIAAAVPTMPISPTPLMPSGLTVSSGSSTKMTSMSWTSAFTGT